jgi:hypothetical protein
MFPPISMPAPVAAKMKTSAIHFKEILFFSIFGFLLKSQPYLILHTFSASSCVVRLVVF